MGKICAAVLSILLIFALSVAEKELSHELILKDTATTSGVQQEFNLPVTVAQEEGVQDGISARTASEEDISPEQKTGRLIDINMGSFLSTDYDIGYNLHGTNL